MLKNVLSINVKLIIKANVSYNFKIMISIHFSYNLDIGNDSCQLSVRKDTSVNIKDQGSRDTRYGAVYISVMSHKNIENNFKRLEKIDFSAHKALFWPEYDFVFLKYNIYTCINKTSRLDFLQFIFFLSNFPYKLYPLVQFIWGLNNNASTIKVSGRFEILF